MHVLVLDDSSTSRQAIIEEVKQLFAEVALEFTESASVDDSLERLRNDSIDVLLLDLGLPDHEPADTLRTFAPLMEDVPTVVVTCYDKDPQLIKLAAESGAVGYVSKHSLSVLTFALGRAFKVCAEHDQLTKVVAEVEEMKQSVVELKEMVSKQKTQGSQGVDSSASKGVGDDQDHGHAAEREGH